MTEKLTFIEKVITVQAELKAPKGQENKFGNYKYRSAEDIVEAVKPLNQAQGLLLTLTDKPILMGERYYIEATATLTDGTDSQVVTAYARESLTKKGMDDSQITGTASSYARKYALNGLYLIDDTKDADTNEFKNQEMKAKTINKKQADELLSNFNQIAELKKVSPKSVEAQFLALVEFAGTVPELDTELHHKLIELTKKNIAKINKQQLEE